MEKIDYEKLTNRKLKAMVTAYNSYMDNKHKSGIRFQYIAKSTKAQLIKGIKDNNLESTLSYFIDADFDEGNVYFGDYNLPD